MDAKSDLSRFRSCLAFSLAFRALELILLTPLVAVIVRVCLARWGRASVGNFEIVAFFCSPIGLVALLAGGAVLLATLYLEVSGLARLLADERLHWWQAFMGATGLFHRLVRLGLRQLAAYVLLAVPFLVGAGVVYWLFWSGKDLNGLLILKPPSFWWGAGLAGVIAAIFSALGLLLFFRWLYAVPILTFEPESTVPGALRMSVQRSQGTLWRCGRALAIWAAVQGALAAVVLGLVRWGSQSILSGTGPSLPAALVMTGLILAVDLTVAVILRVLATATFAGVVLSLYRQTAPEGALDTKALEPTPQEAMTGWMLGATLAIVVSLTVTVAFLAIRDVKLAENLEITAHRAGAISAPENTVAALKQAIADHADWAEIDVQLTADQALVILHDIDLARVGGGPRRVDQATLEDIRALDIGSSFGPQFAGEQIPTLGEVLAAAGAEIRLNIELKPHSKSDGLDLTRRVIEEVRQAEMVDRCRLCSQSYESLQLARQLEPRLDVGFIVATAVGEPTKLDVQFLMVKSNLATRKLVERARLRNIPVHAWTVNDAAEVAPLLDAGIANLITDAPAQIRAKLDEIRALSTVERLLLRARHALAR